MNFADLFAGAGGLSLGLIRAGFEPTVACDTWSVAVDNYARNVGDHIQTVDLANPLKVIRILLESNVSFIAGGPPCQDFSAAGGRQEGENASLTLAFSSIVVSVRPSWFLMENVILAESSEAWQAAYAMFKAAGYGLSVLKIDCSLYGVPQVRRRLFLIGRLGERDGFLDTAVRDVAAAKSMTLRDLFGDATPPAVYFAPRMLGKRAVFSAHEPAPTIRSASARPIPQRYKPHPEDAFLVENGYVYSRPLHGGRGVRSIDEPMATITRTSWERPTPRYLNNPHPSDAVCASDTAVLTMRQVARIQGFPEHYEWRASAKRDIYQMIANAVPAPVAQAIGQVILARHRGENIPVAESRFVRWLQRRGKSPASARKIKSHVNRARRLLRGRMLAEPTAEIAMLQANPDFALLTGSTKSALRQALLLYAEFLDSKDKRRKRLRPPEMPTGAKKAT